VIDRRVVVTGRGVVSPLGVGVDAHWSALIAGCSAIAPIERLRALGLGASRGAEIAPALLEPHLGRLPRKQQKLYNRPTLLAMLAAALAMDEAALPRGAGDPVGFGVVLGVNALSWNPVAMTDYLVAAESPAHPGTLDMAAANTFCMRHINPLEYSLKTLPNLAAGHLAIAHDAQGICRAVTEGPVGGATAVGDAYQMIREGQLDVALCGGADALLDELLFASYAGARLLATDDGGRTGLVAGEGSGIVVLEALERARARGAVVHGEILGFAATAGSGQLPVEDDAGRLAARLAAVLERVLAEAGRAPDVVSLHADGLETHDAAEEAALRRLATPPAPTAPRLRMKRAHADLGAASLPVEFLACSCALGQDILPPAVAVETSRPTRTALLISLGLFGECVALMLGIPES
jgi:3-oxoacyl-[acyl-carrier-protein] synthase II